jgi:hypothetical protein
MVAPTRRTRSSWLSMDGPPRTIDLRLRHMCRERSSMRRPPPKEPCPVANRPQARSSRATTCVALAPTNAAAWSLIISGLIATASRRAGGSRGLSVDLFKSVGREEACDHGPFSCRVSSTRPPLWDTSVCRHRTQFGVGKAPTHLSSQHLIIPCGPGLSAKNECNRLEFIFTQSRHDKQQAKSHSQIRYLRINSVICDIEYSRDEGNCSMTALWVSEVVY